MTPHPHQETAPPDWQYGKPPNEQWVEAERDGTVVTARAIWGRDGTLPHWEMEGGILISPQEFLRWRVRPTTGLP